MSDNIFGVQMWLGTTVKIKKKKQCNSNGETSKYIDWKLVYR